MTQHTANTLIIQPGRMTLAELRQVWQQPMHIRLADEAYDAIHASAQAIEQVLSRDAAAYGINTGFGLLAKKRIPSEQLMQLQRNLILSHSVGTGEALSPEVVRLILLMKIASARLYRRLLTDSEIRRSHEVEDDRVQDPYSLRCQPQVMGACLDLIHNAARTLLIEANAVTDNPLIFRDQEDVHVLSGGNFHAEPVAFAADNLALAIAEIGALSERRVALLIDATLSGLPAFLVDNPGVNSGFMIAHVTAAALASENKSLAHPASVDSLPTSANQEDHVSMATFAGRRLHEMAHNTATIVGIELLAAAQGIDFHRPLRSSACLEQAHALLRTQVTRYGEDRLFAPDIEAAKGLVLQGGLVAHCAELFADVVSA